VDVVADAADTRELFDIERTRVPALRDAESRRCEIGQSSPRNYSTRNKALVKAVRVHRNGSSTCRSGGIATGDASLVALKADGGIQIEESGKTTNDDD
jgi:hypothetical protein